MKIRQILKNQLLYSPRKSDSQGHWIFEEIWFFFITCYNNHLCVYYRHTYIIDTPAIQKLILLSKWLTSFNTVIVSCSQHAYLFNNNNNNHDKVKKCLYTCYKKVIFV